MKIFSFTTGNFGLKCLCKDMMAIPKTSKYNHKEIVGPEALWDIMAAHQFNLLTMHGGLRSTHQLLDIGCGSLRAGRIFLSYLDEKKYYGIEPNLWLLRQGIEKEVSQGLISLKQPKFHTTNKFNLSVFGEKFDFILAQSIWSHSPFDWIINCVENMPKVMYNDSKVYVSFNLGDQDYKGDKWIPKAYYKFQTLEELIKKNEMKVDTIDWKHPNGLTWLLIQKEDHVEENKSNRANVCGSDGGIEV